MKRFRNLPTRISAGLMAMLIIVAAGDALSQQPHGGHGGPGGPGGHPHHAGPPPGPSGYCGLYPEFRLMRHPVYGGFGYFRLDGGSCLWIEGPPPRHYRHDAPPPPKEVILVPAPSTQNTQSAQTNQTVQPTEKAYCREFQDHILVGDDQVEAYGTACRQPDGSWKFKQSKSPVASDHCREFRRSVTIGEKTEEQTGTACLRPGDVWEIVTTN